MSFKMFLLAILTILMPYRSASSQTTADSLLNQLEVHLRRGSAEEATSDLYQLRYEIQSQKPIDAINYMRKASDLSETHDNKLIQGFSYYILGNIYFDLELYHQALDYQIKCYRLYMENRLQDSLGYVFIDIGNAYFAQGLNTLPDQFYRKSVQTFTRQENLWLLPTTILRLLNNARLT